MSCTARMLVLSLVDEVKPNWKNTQHIHTHKNVKFEGRTIVIQSIVYYFFQGYCLIFMQKNDFLIALFFLQECDFQVKSNLFQRKAIIRKQ